LEFSYGIGNKLFNKEKTKDALTGSEPESKPKIKPDDLLIVPVQQNSYPGDFRISE
jgi:hypothetical protein